MEIRPPHKPNYPAIAELLKGATDLGLDTEALVGRVMADQHFDPNLVWMAREEGEMLGFLATVLEGPNAWIKLIAVHGPRRRRGLGREMLDRAEERLFGEGAGVMRAGFGPGPLFYPGVPEGPAAEFFAALGYASSPGGVIARVESGIGHAGAAKADPAAAKALIHAASPLWWSEVEERFSFPEPRLAMSRDGKALCLADPGRGLGPLFSLDEASALEAAQGALAIAGEGARLADSRPPEWWLARFSLKDAARCFEFRKDLRGAFHA